MPPSPPATATGPRDYERLVEPHRAALHAHCCRMLGSSQDAEDALQEALLRAWRGLDRFEGRSSLRSWLYTIATNACHNHAARRKPVIPVDFEAADPHDAALRALLADDSPGPGARWERRESAEAALAIAFERLEPYPRAVLIMREVLGFSARETAAELGTTVAAVNSALPRARRRIDEAAAEADAAVRPGPGALRAAQAFAAALERGEIGTIVAALAGPAARR